ncbi:MAG: T9SS type A sorting domain-containing protein, partial [Bacteroidales bacterium]|nr:T9SS type A sorting domain-containing protein [Bacteroidales bacterium]
MLKRLLSIGIALLLCAAVTAQTVTLTFSGRDAQNHYVQLNRVMVTNLTRGWQETLEWPDTTLTLQAGTDIQDVETMCTSSLQLAQNTPNPFNGTTDVNLMVADAGAVSLEIMDRNGRVVETTHALSLLTGTHQFRITLSQPGLYLLTARQNGKTSSIKMVCNGAGNNNKIVYAGIVETPYYDVSTKSMDTRGVSDNPFTAGD